MLIIQKIITGYGKKRVIDEVSLNLQTTEIVSIIGHNGSGKSTILKAIIGALPIWNGKVIFEGQHLSSTPYVNIRKGISFLPQGGQVFDELTVKENLEIASFILKDKKEVNDRINKAYQQFPKLYNRRNQQSSNLSGGEQQMLALGMAMVQQPKLLLLDEPSIGLAPRLVSDIFHHISYLREQCNMAVLIAEQKVKEVLDISDRTYILKLGKVAYSGRSSELLNSGRYKKVLLK
jgi:branched-chain amino acid transport system ATP-binding protein